MLTQKDRLREALIRAYQTELVFRKGWFPETAQKLLTFLGIAVPLLAGGIIMSLYSDAKPPDAILVGAGLLGAFQTVASVWALVDQWDRKSQKRARILRDFTYLRIELEHFRPDEKGFYNEHCLQALEERAARGIYEDNEFEIPSDVRSRTRAEAEARYKDA